MSKIPVKNIYYMLCYAWNILDEAENINVELDSFNQEINLFGTLLNTGLNYQFQRGVYKNYTTNTKLLSLIKGKIEFGASVKKSSFENAKAVCSYDEYSEDIIHNQLIKAALLRVLASSGLDSKLALEIRQTISTMSGVSYIEYEEGLFKGITIPNNYSFYKFLLSISEFILNNSSQNERTGKYHFTDFTRDEYRMRKLYEKFIFNFYKKEVGGQYHVENKREKYVGANYQREDSKYIPTLLTDIELKSRFNSHRIILDTKFTQETLSKNMYGQERMHSKYLMQLMTYLENRKRSTGEIPSGILLYPTIDKHYEFTNKIWDYNVSIYNINLNEDWSDIKYNLIRLIDKHVAELEGSEKQEIIAA